MNLNESWPSTCWILFVKIVPELFLDEYKPHWDKLQTWNMTNKCCNELNTIRGSAVGVSKLLPTRGPQTLNSKRPQYNRQRANAWLTPRNVKHPLYFWRQELCPKANSIDSIQYYKLWIINRSLEPILRLSWKARAFEKSCHPRAVLMPNVPEATALQRTEQDLTGSCLHNINPSIWFARKCHNAQTRSLPSNTDIQRRKAERKTRS